MIALATPEQSVLCPSRAESQAERIEKLQQTVSASRLSCFHACRLKFFFRYVLKVAKPVSIALFTGKVVHAVLQAWSKARWRGLPASRETLREEYGQQWAAQQETEPVKWDDGEEADQQTRTWDLIDTYLAHTPIPVDEKPQAVEVKVEAELPGLPKLNGIIDLVRPKGLIVDYKTTGQTPQPDRQLHQHEIQLTAYGLLYREATGERETGFQIHSLVKLKTPKVVIAETGPVTSKQEKRLLQYIESYVDGLDRRDFVPSPGMQCVACEYFRECHS